MQVTPNVKTVIDTFTFTLSPAETDALRNILSSNLDNAGVQWYFTTELRNNIDDAKQRAGVSSTSVIEWVDAGNVDSVIRQGTTSRIAAIRQARAATGASLRDAKAAVDARYSALGVHTF